MSDRKNKKIKILFIFSFPPPYHGANISNQILWESKVQQEFNCKLIDISDRRDLNNLGRFELTNIYLALMHLFIIAKTLIKFKPDMVYMLISQNKWAVVRDGAIILLVKTISNAKIINHLRGAFFKYFYDNTSNLMKKFVDFTLKKVNAFIVLGDNLRFNFEKWSKNIFVVTNGTDVLINYNIEEKYKEKNEVVITYLSNFFKSKGIVEVVKSVKEVITRFPDKKIIYKIAGDWGLDPILGLTKEEIKAEVDKVLSTDGTAKYIHFMGVITGEKKLNLLKETDIFLLPTSYDAHPRSILEAMAAGCPVISTPIGAIPETVIDNETGFIIEPGNHLVLTEKITQLIENENLRKKLSIGSRKRYEACYTTNKSIEKMIQVFHSIAKQ